MRRFVLAVLLLSIVTARAAAAVPALEPTRQGFQWRQGPLSIQIEKGNWTAAVEGGGQVAGRMFYRHDHFTYETLAGGALLRDHFAPRRLRRSPRRLLHARAGPAAAVCLPHPAAGRRDSRVLRTAERRPAAAQPRPVAARHRANATASRATSGCGWSPPWAAPGRSLAARATACTSKLKAGRAVSVGGPGIHEMDAESTQNHTYVQPAGRDFPPAQQSRRRSTRSASAICRPTFPGEIQPGRQPLAIGRVEAQRGRGAAIRQAGAEGRCWPPATTTRSIPTRCGWTPNSRRPRASTIVVPGFFMVDFRREVQEQPSCSRRKGSGGWKVRFTPREIGRYTWRLTLADRSGKAGGGEGEFRGHGGRDARASSAAAPPIRTIWPSTTARVISPSATICPPTIPAGQLGDEAMRKFAAAKENYNRWWLTSDSLGIEWTEHLGWYRQDAAARLDLVLDQAAELGLYYMLCMDTHQDFRERGWERNPFNAANGGPCAKPADWFTDATAKNYYKKRLRYTVARWGYSPQRALLGVRQRDRRLGPIRPTPSSCPGPRRWPTISAGSTPSGTSSPPASGPTPVRKNTGSSTTWTSCKRISTRTTTPAWPSRSASAACTSGSGSDKPHIFGEFGIRAGAGTPEKDPQGWAIHNGLWAGLFSFAAGGPMPWWHEELSRQARSLFPFHGPGQFHRRPAAGHGPLEPAADRTAAVSSTSTASRRLRDAIVGPRGAGLDQAGAQRVPGAARRQPGRRARSRGRCCTATATATCATRPRSWSTIRGRESSSCAWAGCRAPGGCASGSTTGRCSTGDLPCGEGLGKPARYVAAIQALGNDL